VTILQALAHQPLTRYELSFLVGITPDEVSDAIFDQLAPDRLVEMDEGSDLWSITEDGRKTIELTEECNRLRRRDAECQGVTRG
jgi:hypothetical protein